MPGDEVEPAASATNRPIARGFPRLRLGVGSHLALGLAAVALVVVAGHLAAKRTTHAAIEAVGRVQRTHEPAARLAGAVIENLAAFDRTIADAANSAQPDSAQTIAAAGVTLAKSFDAYKVALQEPLSAESALLGARLAEHVDAGHLLVARASERAAWLRGRHAALERMNRRMVSAGGGGLAIDDNQVFTRRSLAELSAALNALRGGFVLEGARQTEERFAALLRAHGAELAGSPGRNWLDLQREDFQTTRLLRHKIERFDLTDTPARQRFLADGAALISSAQSLLEEPARRALESAARQAAISAAEAERALRQTGIAVLVVVLLVSVLLARRIIIPVRRLNAMTRRLAAGQRTARAERGGSAELDELAKSFNLMADHIAAAESELRAHHAELEQRVVERTHQLQHLAHHDPLTQLPNRRQLAERLAAAVERAATTHERFALLFVDLDNFKSINDTLGHTFGDQVLQTVGERLRRAAGAHAFLARLGGDEFTVLLEGVPGAESVMERAAQLIEALQRPIVIDERVLSTSASVGASLCPDHARDVDALLRAADVALFRAKELGRNRAALYSPELYDAAAQRFKLEQALRRAVEAGDLLLMYQPQVSLHTLQPLGVEALMRWRKPDGRIATASEFIHVAEKTGLMRELTGWVLRSATSTVTAWRAMGWHKACVSINVSAPQFLETDFVDHVVNALEVTGLPASALELELTETVLQTGVATIESLRRLRDIGVAIALDDFGIGYSSLTSLEQLPLTRVKLDRTLIEGIDASPRSAAIARSVIGLCHGLGLQVIAEGVERLAQLEFLSQCGPVGVQGFLLAQPVEADAVPYEISAAAARAARFLKASGNPSGADEKALVFVKSRRKPR